VDGLLSVMNAPESVTDPTTDRVRQDMALWHRLVIAVAVGSLLVTVATVSLWPRDDEPQHPDAVVVLGGAGPERVRLGIELSERYDATLVLSALAIGYGVYEGVDCRSDPEILCLYPEPRTTAGEARAIAVLAEESNWGHVTVATARFHSTRARVLLRQCLNQRVTVVGAPPTAGHPRTFMDYAGEALGTVAAVTFERACRWRPTRTGLGQPGRRSRSL
jgi:uncharacterized SAM-binding protein YcdF (DUF218 family)